MNKITVFAIGIVLFILGNTCTTAIAGDIGFPTYGNDLRQSISLGGLDVYADVENNDETFDIYYGSDGSIFKKPREKETHGYLSANAVQGCFGGQQILPYGIDLRIERNSYDNMLNVDATFCVLFVDKVTVEDLERIDSRLELDILGFDFYANQSFGPEDHWEKDPVSGEWVTIETTDLNGRFSFNFTNAVTKSLQLGIQDYCHTEHIYDPTSEETIPIEWTGFKVGAKFQIECFVDSSILDAILPIPPMPEPSSGSGGGGVSFSASSGFAPLSSQTIPEPGTLTLILIGLIGLVCFHRRANR